MLIWQNNYSILRYYATVAADDYDINTFINVKC